MPTRAQKIAHVMCRQTHAQLLPALEDWQPGSRPRLEFRVGRGRATHHRFDFDARQHRITYGVKMVAEKANPRHCAGWLSVREMTQREYFGGALSELNLLAHTCCHEFAHLVQSLKGWRPMGEVHNAGFYRILDGLYAGGHGERLRSGLQQACQAAGAALDEQTVSVVTAGDLLARFAPGDEVTFGDGHQGRVVRVNRKTCTVEGTAHCRGLRYRVSPQLLKSL